MGLACRLLSPKGKFSLEKGEGGCKKGSQRFLLSSYQEGSGALFLLLPGNSGCLEVPRVMEQSGCERQESSQCSQPNQEESSRSQT